MDLVTLKSVLMWCTVINAALLFLAFIFCAAAGNWIYGMHSRWLPIPREAFNIAIYSFIGLYKIAFFVFNLVPYIALCIAR
ncbi:MAG: hypothetical protein RDV48_24695 [Candidatus Eremiobacteraeota bacterium]|nr:hypothetical protein [Candidatus Eremiobacteraeota bacterium]